MSQQTITENTTGDTNMKLILFFVVLPFLTGCTITSYTTPSGECFKRTALGTNTRVGVVEIQRADGTKVSIKGYNNDQAELAGIIAEGVAKGLKP